MILDSAVRVHRHLGPGLLESIYEACLEYELTARGFSVRCQVPIPVCYESLEFPAGFRADMLVNDLVIIENKVVPALLPVHQSQLLTYLRLSGVKLGFLINWYVPIIRDGIKRMAAY